MESQWLREGRQCPLPRRVEWQRRPGEHRAMVMLSVPTGPNLKVRSELPSSAARLAVWLAYVGWTPKLSPEPRAATLALLNWYVANWPAPGRGCRAEGSPERRVGHNVSLLVTGGVPAKRSTAWST